MFCWTAGPRWVGSYKGTMLEVGERSGLVIGPGGSACTVTSSDPDTVEVEQVMNFWTAVAKAEGSAEITVSNQTGETGTLTLTVGSHAPQAPTVESSPDQGEALDVRLELVRLVNEVRRENGVAELPVSEALMSAAQTISDKKYTWHHTKEECEAALACGYRYLGNFPSRYSESSRGAPLPPSVFPEFRLFCSYTSLRDHHTKR